MRSNTESTEGSAARSSRHGRLPSVPVASAIASVELRRRIRQRTLWLWLLVFAVGIMLVGHLLFTIGFEYGSSPDETGWTTYLGVVLFVGLVGVAGYHFLNGVGPTPANLDGLLAIRPAKDVVGGQLLYRFAESLFGVLVPMVAFFAGIATALRTPWPLIGAVLAVTVLNALGVVLGFTVGSTVKGLGRRYRVLRRYWYLFAMPPGVGYFVFLYLGGIGIAVDRLRPLVLHSPIDWLGDLALLTTPGFGADPRLAIGALALASGLIVTGVLCAVRATRFAWSVDVTHDPGRDDDQATSDTGSLTMAAVLDSLCRRRATSGVAEVAVRRAYRSPYLLVISAFLLLGAIPLVEDLVTSGTIPWYTPWLVVWYGAWLGGTVLPLNVLGSQGRALPGLLASRAGGRCVVNGHVVGSAVLFALPTTLLTGAAALVASRAPTTLLLVVVVAPLAVVGSALLSTGVGVRFPRYQSIVVHGEDGTIPPSKPAYAVLSGLLTIGLGALVLVADGRAIGLVASGVGSVGAIDPVAARTLVGAAAAVALLGSSLAAVGSYRYAVRRLDDYDLASGS